MACPATTDTCWLTREFSLMRQELIRRVNEDAPDASVFSPISLMAMGIDREHAEHVLHWAVDGSVVALRDGMPSAGQMAWLLIGALALGMRVAKRGLA